MSVYKRGEIWWYDFKHRGVRYRRSTGQLDQDDAAEVERQEKKRVRRAARGLIDPEDITSPRFQEWAEDYFEHVRDRDKIDHPERIERLIRRALWFWGAATDRNLRTSFAPRHDLRLRDVVTDPRWILKWEAWLDEPKPAPGRAGTKPAPLRIITWSAQTKNQYRSVMSGMYKLAMSPAWRLETGIVTNPFAGGYRDRPQGRQVAIERDDLTAILRASSFHLRLAIAIGLLTPKFRQGNILALRFDREVSTDARYITVQHHKTRRSTRRPLVAYVPDQLREILLAERARKRKLGIPWVITYQGRRMKSLRGAFKGAVTRAAATRPHLLYGRDLADGVTFHTIRHSAATLLAELDVTPQKAQGMMAHRRIETTMLYTHLKPKHEAAIAEQLSAALPLKELVLAPRLRAVGTLVPRHRAKPAKMRGKPTTHASSRRRKKSG